MCSRVCQTKREEVTHPTLLLLTLCNKKFNSFISIQNSQICAGGKGGINVSFQEKRLCVWGRERETFEPIRKKCDTFIYRLYKIFSFKPCRGDSGGPLMKLVRSVYWQLVGIVSFGPKVCAIDGIDSKAAVFTKVQYYIPWIVQNAL